MFESNIQMAGNLVEDPNLKILSNGTCLTTFRLACSSRRFDRVQGRWVDGDTVFLRVSCWRQLAENVSASLRRGDRAVVLGRLRQNTYQSRDGSWRHSYELDAQVIGAELTWQSVHVRRSSRSAAGGAESRHTPGAVTPGGPPAGHHPGTGIPTGAAPMAGAVPTAGSIPAGSAEAYRAGYTPVSPSAPPAPNPAYPVDEFGDGAENGVGSGGGAGAAGWDGLHPDANVGVGEPAGGWDDGMPADDGVGEPTDDYAFDQDLDHSLDPDLGPHPMSTGSEFPQPAPA